MSSRWSEFSKRIESRVLERYDDLVVYQYYDQNFNEVRYAVVLDDRMLVNNREYPGKEICNITDIYQHLNGKGKK